MESLLKVKAQRIILIQRLYAGGVRRETPPLVLAVLLDVNGEYFDEIFSKLLLLIVFESHPPRPLPINVPRVTELLNECLSGCVLNLKYLRGFTDT